MKAYPNLPKICFAAVCILTSASYLHAGGALDLNFGASGKATAPVGGAVAFEFTLQPDGKILVIGTGSSSGTGRDAVLARFESRGILDSAFGNGGVVRTPVEAGVYLRVVTQTDGKIVLLGSIDGDFLVFRLEADGSRDPLFGNNGVVRVDGGSAESPGGIALQTDGKIVATGNTSNTAGNIVTFRLNGGDGSLDTSFGQAGFVYYNLRISSDTTTYVHTRNIATLSNNRILIASGAMAPILGHNAYSQATVLLVMNASGEFDPDFGTNGRSDYSYGFSDTYYTTFVDLVIFDSGKIMTVGAANALFSPSGSVEYTYRGDFPGAPFYNSGIAGWGDGRYVALNFDVYADHANAGTAYHSSTHRIMGLGIGILGSDIAVQQDGKILVLSAEGDNLLVRRFLAIGSQGTRIADYDRDGITDLLYYSPQSMSLHILGSSGSTDSYASGELPGTIRRAMPERQYFVLSNYPYPFTYRKIGVRGNPSLFCSGDGAAHQPFCVQWGVANDIPVGGDYDGDRRTDWAVFRPANGTWYIESVVQSTTTVQWGALGDKPVPADYDFDGITDIAVYRPSTGMWWVRRSSDQTYHGVQFGIESDIPLTGDFDGDGYADLTVFRPEGGIWYQYLTTEGFRVTFFGISTDIPVPGDYDGDGRHDIAVYREGTWHILQSTNGYTYKVWGSSLDVPVSVRSDE